MTIPAQSSVRAPARTCNASDAYFALDAHRETASKPWAPTGATHARRRVASVPGDDILQPLLARLGLAVLVVVLAACVTSIVRAPHTPVLTDAPHAALHVRHWPPPR
jgi:hypothetical protein